MGLWLISSRMLRQQLREPDRLPAKLLAHEFVAGGRFVAFIEQQIKRLLDAVEPPRQLVTRWNFKWNLRFLDFLFCARQSFRNRRLSRYECAADFRHVETAE